MIVFQLVSLCIFVYVLLLSWRGKIILTSTKIVKIFTLSSVGQIKYGPFWPVSFQYILLFDLISILLIIIYLSKYSVCVFIYSDLIVNCIRLFFLLFLCFLFLFLLIPVFHCLLAYCDVCDQIRISHPTR